MRRKSRTSEMQARRQKVRRDVLAGGISNVTDLTLRYGVSYSTIRNDLLAIEELTKVEMEETLPNELVIAMSRYEANALRALNAFEESRRKRVDCKICKGTGWVKKIGKRIAKYKTRRVKCPKKFIEMALDNGMVREHRLVVAREINRCLLEEEVVHHIDMDERNNKPTNLMLFSNDFDHNQFHSGLRVSVVWSGTPNVRPIEEKEWCGNCDGEGFIWYNVPGNVAFLAEYRGNIKERATVVGLYPKTGSNQHLHLYGASEGKIKVIDIPSEMILEARIFQDELEKHKIGNNSIKVEDLNIVDEGDDTKGNET